MAISDKLKSLQDAILAGNIPQLVMLMIGYAISIGSSDIHIEPEKSTIQVRYRVDGMLRRIVEYPLNIHPAVVSRIKIMSNLKIDEQRIPQDGRCHVTTEDNREMDLRVSTLPTINGEKIVMRIQDTTRKIPTLEELGLTGNCLKFIQEAITYPNGIILTSGPTGSGKTTTLYSCLSMVNTPEVNILTIEDPVEIQMNGLNQSQVHADINYTFANGLRTALRQDPDIVMVGEIRDRETVDIAIEASLTGHLVFSTIHTNSAVETVTRIDNMDVPLFLVTATLNTVISQRLARKVCDKCKEVFVPDEMTLNTVKKVIAKIPDSEGISPEMKNSPVFYKGKGCEVCGNLGYKGRVGLYEVMQISDSLKRSILKRIPAIDLEQQAMEEGMISLEQSGLIKALNGLTTLEEVYRLARKSTEESDAAKKKREEAELKSNPEGINSKSQYPSRILGTKQ